MEIEINRISLYLAWKLPPYYKPFDKMEFIEELMWIFSDNFSENTFNFIQNQTKTDEQFYSMSLNKAKRIDENKLILFLNKIKVEEDARSVVIKDDKKNNKCEDDDLKKENIELNQRIKKLTKPLIITEWKTDVKILNTAWEKLYPDKECPFEIIENWVEKWNEKPKNWSAEWVKNQLNYSSIYWKNRIIIWLFDNDKEWNEQFKWLYKDLFEEYNISKDIRRHNKYNIYWLLLSVPEFRKNYVNKNNIKQRYFQIEHYFSDKILNDNNMKKDEIIDWTWIFEIWNSKNAFSEVIKKLDVKEFENFKILFERIKKYL